MLQRRAYELTQETRLLLTWCNVSVQCNGITDLKHADCRTSSFCIKYSHKYRRTSKIGERWNSTLEMGGVADPKTHAPPRHVYVKFGSSASNDVCINSREPQNLGSTWALPPCARDIADPYRNTLLPCAISSHFGHSRSYGTNITKEIRLKNLTLVSHLSRSLKVIGTNTYRSITYDLILTFHNNHGPILYCVRDRQQLQSKITNFLHPCIWHHCWRNWVLMQRVNKKLSWCWQQARRV